jgi:DNA-binding CsgD family transcriptional regulator
MLLRKCGEIGRGSRSSTELGRRRRHRRDSARVINWPTEQRVIDPPDDGPDESQVVRSIARPAGRAGRGLADAPVGLSWLWQLLGQSSAAREQWSELLRLAATSADREVRAETLNVVGRFASAAGDLATGQTFFQEALVAGRAGQDSGSVARSLSGLAQIAASRGAFDLARTLEEEGLMIRRRLGDTAETARSLAVLAWLTLESRGAAQAEALHEESLTLRVTLGEPLALAYSLVHLGWVAHLVGRRDSARQHLAEALMTVRSCTDRWKVVALLALLGRPSPVETPTRQAVLLLTAAEALEASTAAQVDGSGESPVHLEEARERLDARALAIAWSGGRDVDAEGLVEQALRAAGPHPPHDRHGAGGPAEPMPLTPRELEVATLISRGHTNRRIADVLVIAERTAETHARNIREKLGLMTRAQIAAWAAVRVNVSPPEPR